MISLFLDTSSYKIIVGVYQDLKELSLNIETNDQHLSEKILPLIDQTLEQAKIKITDINNIIVVNGPGSFTGIRIGVTVAKILAWANNAKISTVSELEVMVGDPDTYTASIIDARRGYVYAGLYDKKGKSLIADQYIDLKLFLDQIKQYSNVQLVSYDDFKIDHIKKPDLNIGKIIESHIDDEGLNPHSVNPNYLKLTEAEEKLNDQENKE